MCVWIWMDVEATIRRVVDWKSVRGVINGDKNGLFQKLRAEDSVAPGLMAVSAPNVRRAPRAARRLEIRK